MFSALFSLFRWIRQTFVTLWKLNARLCICCNNCGSRHYWLPGRWVVLSSLECKLFFQLVMHFWCTLYCIFSSFVCVRTQSPTLVRERSDHRYITKNNYLHWYKAFWVVSKANPCGFMSKRDNIISLWRYGGSIVLIIMNIHHRLECLDWNENSFHFL